jgi:phenylalanyl-tRNA synthetase beta subunit
MRAILADRLNLNEVLTYSFVSKDLQEKVGEDFEDSYEIVNSISPELQCFRQSIAPSLIDKMYENIRAGHKEFGLFEFNQVTNKKLGLTEENVPEIENHTAMISTSDFYFAKAILLELFKRLHIDVELEENNMASFPYFEKVRSAKITLDGETIGVVGEIKNRVLKNFKVKKAAGFELNLDKIVGATRNIKAKLRLSKYPFVERDITLKTAADAKFAELEKGIENVFEGSELIYKVTPVSIYQGEDKTSKNISFHISFSSPEKTLEAKEISDIMGRIEQTISELHAELV